MSIDGIKTTPPGNSTGGVQHIKKASQSLPPAGGKKIFNHFLSRHVRERKYFSGCKCGICPPSAGKLCAQQTASLLSKNPLGFSTFLTPPGYPGGVRRRLSKKWLCHFFEKASLRSAPLLSADSGQFDAHSAQSVFCHAHVAAENISWIYNISATNKRVDSQVEIL